MAYCKPIYTVWADGIEIAQSTTPDNAWNAIALHNFRKCGGECELTEVEAVQEDGVLTVTWTGTAPYFAIEITDTDTNIPVLYPNVTSPFIYVIQDEISGFNLYGSIIPNPTQSKYICATYSELYCLVALTDVSIDSETGIWTVTWAGHNGANYNYQIDIRRLPTRQLPKALVCAFNKHCRLFISCRFVFNGCVGFEPRTF